MQNIDDVSMGTIMKIDNQLCAVLESKSRITLESLQGIFQNVEIRIIHVDKIPCDPRHQSKIDYQVLREDLK